MRTIFLGTSDFAIPSLAMLCERSDIDLQIVITQPDKPQGRGQRLQPTPVKAFAQKRSLNVLQPLRLRQNEDIRSSLTALAPDLLVVVSYGQILPPWLVHLAPHGALNVHASLLPAYRGAGPIQWVLLNGEKETGITIMRIDEGMDSGPMLLQQKVVIKDQETAGELHNRLAELGSALLNTSLDLLAAGRLHEVGQDHCLATMAPRIRKEMGWLNWGRPAGELHNRVRAMNPWPGAFALLLEKELKIWRTRVRSGCMFAGDGAMQPGTVVFLDGRQGLGVSCGDNQVLELLEVSLPGRRRISGAALIHGLRMEGGERFLLADAVPATPGPAGKDS